MIGVANFVDNSNFYVKDVLLGFLKFFWVKASDFGGFVYMEIVK